MHARDPSSFETQGVRYQKSKTGVSVTPQKEKMVQMYLVHTGYNKRKF